MELKLSEFSAQKLSRSFVCTCPFSPTVDPSIWPYDGYSTAAAAQQFLAEVLFTSLRKKSQVKTAVESSKRSSEGTHWKGVVGR